MRRIRVEAMEALAGLREESEQTSFTTAEIAKRLGKAWRVRRSLKSMVFNEFGLVWSDGGDRWCIDPRLVKLLRYVKDIEELKEKA